MKFKNTDYESVLIKDHAVMRMLYRDISKSDLLKLVEFGEIIEDYPNDFPFPSHLLFKVVTGRPLHCVVAVNENDKTLIIVTVYEPDNERFNVDFKTRKRK